MFSAQPTSGRAPLSVQFELFGPGIYELDFGDGRLLDIASCARDSVCSPQKLTHIYPHGRFTVALKTAEGLLIGAYIVSAD